ncbi:MAG: beta-ketoacyl synthase N-terminal-like domain-containing protein, partial [Candidatus Parabeggiatoa sp.]|nr:beta-ketoacyl synthase N-terminal-like domain-containing protein [Candidatus Parabeggiatoa sp.]
MNFVKEAKDTDAYSSSINRVHENDNANTLEEPPLFDTILDYITHTIATVLKVEPSKLDPDDHFESYGLDSILINQLYVELKKQFGQVSPTLLFTYKTINALSEYFLEHHPESINALGLPLSRIKDNESLPSKPKVSTIVFDNEKNKKLEPPLFDTILNYITNTIAATLKVEPSKLDPDTHFEHYGLDSILINQLYVVLKKQFSQVSPTLLFTYKTINALSEYFLEHHPEKINALAQPSSKNIAKDNEPLSKQHIDTVVFDDEPKQVNEPPKKTESNNCNDTVQDIAIIGISGKFPMADNVDEFWENLKAGRDCVTEIPKERWDYQQYPGMYCKRGGFLEDFDKFDTQFFNISPNRARFINPQERLFLQAAWSCIEDAGYTRQRLSDPEDGDRRGNVGVFAGVSFNEYQLHAMTEWEKGNLIPVNSQTCSVANRVSYFMNLRGPSLSIDTACSASLYAIHLACESILRKECAMAIAGGVNLSQHPAKYVTLCSIGMLSNKGRCNAFGQDGDGMVPGEAVGAVLLKPLEQAVKEGDIIYATIKGTTVTHDGKTYGYTVPNPVAQTEVIKAALEKSKVDPRTISYVEAHGTGTALGDPIEIEGLSNAYADYTKDKQYCPIGSVKSNIGQSEAAAGIVQLIKVILQMKHKTLVRSLLEPANRLNPNIQFENTPFYVQQQLEEWKQPTVRKNNRTENLPRRAGISSLGASGVNVHLILEEYPSGSETLDKKQPSIISPLVDRVKQLSLEMDDELKRFEKGLLKFDKWCQLLLLDSFQTMGVFESVGSSVARDELAESLRMVPDYHRLSEAFFKILSSADNITLNHDKISCTLGTDRSGLLNKIAQEKAALEKQYPWIKASIALVQSCTEHYSRILRGKLNAVSVMFPNGSTSLVEGVYNRNNLLNRLLAESVRTYVKTRHYIVKDAKETLNILEVGSGTGGISASILNALQNDQEYVRYKYTDISVAFLHHGQEKFGSQYPFVDFCHLDIEQDPLIQGFEPEQYDLVIAHNVLHATKRMSTTLRNVKSLMKNNGILILSEIMELMAFTTMTFGLLKGWWLFEDPEIRIKGSPLLSPETWKKTLEQAGFRKIEILGYGVHRLIIAENSPINNNLIQQKYAKDNTVIIPLSAMKEESLKEYVENLKIFLEKNETRNEKPKNGNIAYTLQIGREPRQFRVAFLVRTTEELIDKLGHFLSEFTNEPTTGSCYRQNEKQTHESVEE